MLQHSALNHESFGNSKGKREILKVVGFLDDIGRLLCNGIDRSLHVRRKDQRNDTNKCNLAAALPR